mmetsp:Transcript_37518/g.87481  ORF Transcript_37518/g.87481 Transcript_37518/m.87481 type:complete len:205 (-) Transcript_37518:65-679(-)
MDGDGHAGHHDDDQASARRPDARPTSRPCCRIWHPAVGVRRRDHPRTHRFAEALRRGQVRAEGLLEHPHPAAAARGRREGGRGVAWRNPARPRGRLQRRCRRHRVHGRPAGPSDAGDGDGAPHPGQCRLHRHARTARHRVSGPCGLVAHQPRVRPRPQPEDQHRRRAQQTWHLAWRSGSGPGRRAGPRFAARRAAHAHRIGCRL